MRASLIALLLVSASTPAWSTTVYKWVDQAGVVHYSDTPVPNAQKIELGGAQTYHSLGTPGGATGAPAQPAAGGPSAAITTCTIDAPRNDEVFVDVSQVTGHATISPAPRSGNAVRITLDGAPLSGVASDGSFAMAVVRGAHALSLVVTDADGDVVCQAASTFNVRQQSVVAPTAPTAPGVQNQNRPR